MLKTRVNRTNRQQELSFEVGVDVRGRCKLKVRRNAKRRSAKRDVAAPKLGRRPRPERVGFVPHVTRPDHSARHPVHVTMRRVRLGPRLREQRVHSVIVRQIARLAKRGVRVIQYSIQNDHLHLLVEANDRVKLARSMQLLFSRIALAVNRIVARHGSLFRDRHHRHELKTPTEVRRVLVYIFFNTRKHNPQLVGMVHFVERVDDCTSAIWFDDWSPNARPPEDEVEQQRQRAGPSPLTKPQTWLARVGWQRAGGPIRFDEMPKVSVIAGEWLKSIQP